MYNRGYQNQNGMMYQNAKSPVRNNGNMYGNGNRMNNYQYLSPQARQGGMQSQKQMMYSPQQNYTQRDKLKENQPPAQRQDLMYSPTQNSGYNMRSPNTKTQGGQAQNPQYKSPHANQNGMANSRNMAPNLSNHELGTNGKVCNPFQKYQQAMKSPGNSKANQGYYMPQGNQNNAQVMNVRTQGKPQGGFGLKRPANEQYMMQSPKNNNQTMYSPSTQMRNQQAYMQNNQMYQSPNQRNERMQSPSQSNYQGNQRFCSPQHMNKPQQPMNSQQMYSPNACNNYTQANRPAQNKAYSNTENKMAYGNYYSPQMETSKYRNAQGAQTNGNVSSFNQSQENNHILAIDKPMIHPAKSREFLATKGKIDEMLQTAIQRSKELTKQIEETKSKVKAKEQELKTKGNSDKQGSSKPVQDQEEDSNPVIPYKKYNGEMTDKRRHGKGSCIYHTGEVYEGEWKNDRRHGFGSLKTSDEKQIYFGDWESDVFHGKGVFYNVNSKVAEGEIDNKNIGKLMRYLISYDGEFSSGKFEGKGNIVFSNGDKFKGVFSQGIAHGEGLYLTSKGFETKGKWINNKFVPSNN